MPIYYLALVGLFIVQVCGIVNFGWWWLLFLAPLVVWLGIISSVLILAVLAFIIGAIVTVVQLFSGK